MNPDDPVRDGQAETGAPRLAITSVCNALKRLENLDEFRFENARPIVADREASERCV
jgi:hypothetical protein